MLLSKCYVLCEVQLSVEMLLKQPATGRDGEV